MKPTSKLASAVPWSKIREMFGRAQKLDDVVNFGIGEPDSPSPKVVIQAANQALADGHTHYTANAGIPALQEAIADKLRRENAIGVDPSEVIVTAGGMGALYLAGRVLLNDGDEVLASDPVWTNYEGQVALAGAQLRRIPTGRDVGFKITADSLREHTTPATKLVLLNSPANPTGAVISPSELERIADAAAELDLYVISDEVYEHFVWDGARHVSIASFQTARDRTITVGSFSKSYAMTGWRVGYAAGPRELIATMTKLQESIFSCASSVSQMAALAAMEHGRGALDSMIEAYRKRRELALGMLDGIPGLSATRPDGSFYIFVDVSEISRSCEQFAVDLLERERVVVVPGTAFGPGGEGYVRISYATSEAEISRGMARLERYVRSKRSDSST